MHKEKAMTIDQRAEVLIQALPYICLLYTSPSPRD